MPTRRTTEKGYERARALRKRPTIAEAKLWAFLRRGRMRGVGFRRQHAIGPYIVDFYAPKHKLIIEIDGSQHIKDHEQDEARTADLQMRGYRVVRFWNDQVLNDINAVGRTLLEALNLL